jgi:hypothetical protein
MENPRSVSRFISILVIGIIVMAIAAFFFYTYRP